MGSRLVVTIAVLSLAAGLPRAEAAVITEVNSFTGITTFGGRGSPGYANLQVFAPFNLALGVLTGATVELVGTVAPGVLVTNPPSALPSLITFNPTISLAAGSTSSNAAGNFSGVTQALSPETASFGPGLNASQVAAIGAPEAVDLVAIVSADVLQSFAQNPLSVLNYNPAFSPNLGLPSFPSSTFSEDAIATSAQYITTFTYIPSASGGTAVPEPGFLSLGLLGIGAAWLALARRQRSFA